MKKRYYFIGALALVVFLVTVFTIGYFKKTRFEESSPKYDDIVESVYGLGTIKAHNFFDFKSGVIQNLKKIHVREGDSVQVGSPLFESFQGQVFKSPIKGTVTDLPYHEMENIPPQKNIIQIVDLKKIYVEVSLEQDAALRVKKGNNTKITLESFRGKVYQGKVVALFPKQGQFLVHIAVEDLNPNVLPGMTADVSIEIGKKEKALLIPHSAIDAGSVWRKREGKKKKVKVTVGHTDGIWAEIESGDIKITDSILIPKLKKKRN